MAVTEIMLGKKEAPGKLYAGFWGWFKKHEQSFFHVVKSQGNIEKDFFDWLAPKLAEIKEGSFYLVGMLDENTVDLVFTAEGNLSNVGFVEDLVQEAPKIAGWKFTALKPPIDMDAFSISMNGYEFTTENMLFFETEYDEYPDEIDITIAHKDLNEENEEVIELGICVFLDNYLGELEFATTIDNLEITSMKSAQKALRPMTHLKDYLKIRQKQFIEKYQGTWQSLNNDQYSLMQATLKNNNPLIAMINTSLLEWDAKASHPWIATFKIHYNGNEHNGMPNKEDNDLMYEIEDKLLECLLDKDGYLNLGRETADGLREIYFACKDFRMPAQVFYNIMKSYDGKLQFEQDIYKDKYWQSFERFSS